MPATALAVRKPSTPISVRRERAPAESLVCRVAKTRCPVSADSIAISPSRGRGPRRHDHVGVNRRIDRRPAANVSPALGIDLHLVEPGNRYSTGSSTVMMFCSTELSW